jgi:tripartite-type tricarboxylate transporter receptor subunit TctC
VPTARELGYAEMESVVGWSAIFAPPNLSAAVRDKLFAAIQEISRDPAWQAATEQTGSLPYILSPDKTRDYVRSQYKLYRSLGESLNLIDAKVQ